MLVGSGIFDSENSQKKEFDKVVGNMRGLHQNNQIALLYLSLKFVRIVKQHFL